MTETISTPVDLIPAQRQTLWRKPAVVNFAAGGAGAGFYMMAALSAGFRATPAVVLAAWLAPALILVGFLAVALEAGRPLRGPRVLARLSTSWMSRELWLGGAFIALAAGDLVIPDPRLRVLATIAAATFAVAQGFMLRRARGIPAWDVSVIPVLFAMSSLVSGAGLYLLTEILWGEPLAEWLLASTMVLLVFGLVTWLTFVTWSVDEPFASATASLRDSVTSVQLAGGGYVIPFLFVGLAIALPEWRVPLAALGAALMLAEQIHAKAVLILKVGTLRPVTLHSLRLSRGARTHPRRVSS